MKITNNKIVKIEYSREEIEEIIKDHVKRTYSYEGEVNISFYQFIAMMLHSHNEKTEPVNLIVTITKDLTP